MEQFPGIAVESVTDSSRYFVIRIEDGNGVVLLWCWQRQAWGGADLENTQSLF